MKGATMKARVLLGLALLTLTAGCPVPADRDGKGQPAPNMPPPTTPDARQDVPGPPAVKP